eukprot:GHRR01011995.1.p1 GENE.GHRR01011995.1~~GHRR01011995.1.p1  ORF type:complete len:178 (+),score=35.17 GHRR01011995.1:306-839(+)
MPRPQWMQPGRRACSFVTALSRSLMTTRSCLKTLTASSQSLPARGTRTQSEVRPACSVKAGGAFKRSEWGGAICDAMQPGDDDIIIQGKSGLCGFASTNLNFVLRHNSIEHVALAGFLTNCCVESTMRTAYEHGYKVITLTDCCAATSQEEHDAAVKYTFPMFSKPMTHDQFLDKLQ